MRRRSARLGHPPADLRPRYRPAQLRRAPGQDRPARRLPRLRCCSSHLHWDHIQGLPFFAPVAGGGGVGRRLRPASRRAARSTRCSRGVMSTPYFPIRPDQLRGEVAFHAAGHDDFAVERRQGAVALGPAHRPDARVPGRARRRVGRVPLRPRPGLPPTTPTTSCPQDVLELCDGVDLLDPRRAAHQPRSTSSKRHWGHCTIDYAVHVGREAGARELALFHHCPSHGDDAIDEILRDARDLSARIGGPRVIAARRRARPRRRQ